MINALDLHDMFQSQTAAVLGGGPSLPADLARIPRESILIAVNNHALHFCDPEYLVFMDDPAAAPGLASALTTYRGLKVCPKPRFTDVDLGEVEWWDGGFTSPLAVWFACYLGFESVLLCGMDCYQGAEKYCHPRPGFHHPVFDAPLEDHLNAWRPAFKKCPHPERIKAVSGPLVGLFEKIY